MCQSQIQTKTKCELEVGDMLLLETRPLSLSQSDGEGQRSLEVTTGGVEERESECVKIELVTIQGAGWASGGWEVAAGR